MAASACGLCLGLMRSSRTLASLCYDRDAVALLQARDLRQKQNGGSGMLLSPVYPLLQAAANSWRAIKCLASAHAGVSALVPEADIADESRLVEIGIIAGTHGVRGELRVQSTTDFPKERFGKPGLRWLRLRSMRKEKLIPVQLLGGRAISGKQPSWLVTLKGVTSPEQASELLGAIMLADADTKPALLDDEFYVPDLIGVVVAIQESGEEVGVVEDVFNAGGSDLLRVRLVPPSGAALDGSEAREGHLVWVPFVNEIVPVVDLQRRRIEITPPAGLLGLNVRQSGASKDEQRKQDVREKRKEREVLTAVKKKILRLGQEHVLAELSNGDPTQKRSLMESLFAVDYSQFEQALNNLKTSRSAVRQQAPADTPKPPPDFPFADWGSFQQWLINGDGTSLDPEGGVAGRNTARWWKRGLELIRKGKVAVAVLAGGQGTRLGSDAPPVKGMLDIGLPSGKSLFQLQAERLLLVQELASSGSSGKVEDIPWIVMTSDATDSFTSRYFEEKAFFGLKKSQVWFMKQDSIPCVDATTYDILMESPTTLRLAPNGNGGMFKALSSQGILERLVERGIDYLQVYAVDNALIKVADPVFFGFCAEREADIGVKVVPKKSAAESVGVLCLQKPVVEQDGGRKRAKNCVVHIPDGDSLHYSVLEYSEMPEALQRATEDGEGDDAGGRLLFRAAHICVNMFSVDFLKRLCESQVELEFHAALKHIPHMKQMEDGEWVQVAPETPNGIKFEQFIFDAFKFCEPDKVALLEVKREEEFAPVKNASGPGRPDSPSTARDMVLGLYQRLLSTCQVTSEGKDCPDRQQYALLAYAGGLYGEGLQEKDTGVSEVSDDDGSDGQYAGAVLSL